MSTCEGKFKVVAAEGDIRIATAEEKCEAKAEWRVTYFHDTGMESINCCDRCIGTTSIISLMYSAIRLEKNK